MLEGRKRQTKRSLLLFGAFGLLGFSVLGRPAPSKAVEPDPSAVIGLGKAIFHDQSLSEPAGMACASCHAAEAGYTYPSSTINLLFGTVPGAVLGRFGDRRPPMIAYAPFLPTGTPYYDSKAQAWVGGLFWDGRARTAQEQAKFPFFNPNEMNNRLGPNGDPAFLVRKFERGPTGDLFRQVYGKEVFQKSPDEVFKLATAAIVAYEASPEVSSFTSKFDAYLAGKVNLTPTELLGMRFFTGTLDGRPDGLPFRKSAHCMDCHALSEDLSKRPDLFTASCYANLGVPRNPFNPYYRLTNRKSNPIAYNRQGDEYVDLGLGGVFYLQNPLLASLRETDPLRIMGTFKAPCLRNVDKRPYPGFVKAYMHNGALKSLKEVVHFYNSRNLTTVPGEVIDFSKPEPYAGLKGKPLWDPPEYLNPNTLINPTGISSGMPAHSSGSTPTMDLDAMQIGNLHLTDSQEDAIVAFLQTLSDGYWTDGTPGFHPIVLPKKGMRVQFRPAGGRPGK